MKDSNQWIKQGLLFLFLSFLFYFFSFIDQTFYIIFLLNIVFSVFGVMTGLFLKRQHFNKNIYLIITTIIVLILLVLMYQTTISPGYSNKLYSYIFAVIYILGIIWSAYNLIHELDKTQNISKPYDEALEINPDDTRALKNKGASLVEVDIGKALDCFDKILLINPNDSAAWHNKAVLLDKQGKHREALSYYDKALELDPGFKQAKNDNKIILEN
jgi:tetratricopeptide (TPR) repeat protein